MQGIYEGILVPTVPFLFSLHVPPPTPPSFPATGQRHVSLPCSLSFSPSLDEFLIYQCPPSSCQLYCGLEPLALTNQCSLYPAMVHGGMCQHMIAAWLFIVSKFEWLQNVLISMQDQDCKLFSI